MNRAEIRQTFRNENADIPSRVVSDATLNDWCKLGNIEICAKTYCIVTNTSETFTSVASAWYYDMADEVAKFFDIDDFPGGGVYYDNKPLKKTTPGRMNTIDSTWKLRSNGTPTRYWRRGQYLWFDCPTEADKTIAVDCVLIPDDFDSDEKSPYNSLVHLGSYHDAIVKYLKWRGKQAIKDSQGAAIAYSYYTKYWQAMRKQVRAYQQGDSQMRIRERT